MILVRLFGWLCLLAALALFGLDVWRWWADTGDAARFTLTSIAEIWVEIDANSLVGLGSLFQNQWFPENPEIYTDWIVPILSGPAVLPPAILGLLLIIAFRRRRDPEPVEAS